MRFHVPDVGLNGLHRLTHLLELNGNHLVVRFPNGGRWVVRGKLTAQGELVPEAVEFVGGVRREVASSTASSCSAINASIR